MKILSQKNIVWNIVKIVGNLNFSILLLLLIAFISVLGTIIEQDQNLLYYQTNYPVDNISVFSFSWQTIILFGLDHLYATWWFLFIICLFCLSLVICTFSRQLPSLNNARNWKFLHKTKKIETMMTFKSLYYKSLSNMIYSLHSCHYYVFHKSNCIYAYKGLLGRIAPIFVHFSIILTFVGAMMGLFRGFVVQKMVPNGEIFHINNVIKSGFQSQLPSHLVGYIKDFYIEYNPDVSIKQFFSDVSLLNNQGQHLVTKQISVNSPLLFRGFTFYQTDWRINFLRFQIGNASIMQKRIDSLKVGNKNIWLCSLPLNIKEKINIVITSLQDELFVYDSQGKLITKCSVNDEVQIYNTSLIIKGIMASTGLQIKADPGISVVYLGFLILIISVILSYLSYSQIWVSGMDNNLDLAGSTNRAALAFEEDFTAVQKIYILYTFNNLAG